jgi:uncharacterized membrane protein
VSHASARPAHAAFDLSQPMRWLFIIGGSGLMLLTGLALSRLLLGLAEAGPYVRQTALFVHVGTVLPAIPLGLYIFLTRKGDARHRLLGKIWLSLMGITAIATFFIRNVADGGFSWIHVFSVLTLIGIPQAIFSARRGNIARHKRHLVNLFTFALLTAGYASFIPSRTMWLWAFG